MRKSRIPLLVIAAALVAMALPRQSAALPTVVCEIFCRTQGNETCWQASNCSQHCCVTGSRGCFSPCD